MDFQKSYYRLAFSKLALLNFLILKYGLVKYYNYYFPSLYCNYSNLGYQLIKYLQFKYFLLDFYPSFILICFVIQDHLLLALNPFLMKFYHPLLLHFQNQLLKLRWKFQSKNFSQRHLALELFSIGSRNFHRLLFVHLYLFRVH